MLTCIISTLLGILAGRVSPMTGFFFVLKYLEFFFVYFMVINTITDRREIKQLVLLSFIICFLVSLYAIIQIPAGGRATLPFEGEIGEPNTMGGYLVLMLCLVGGLFLHVTHRKGRIMLTSLAGVIMVALLATQSRSSYIAVLVTFGAFSILSLLRHRKIGILAFLASLLLFSPFLLPSFVKERIAYTFLQPKEAGQIEVLRGVQLDTSTSARIRSWEEGLRDFKEHPLFGYGVTGYGFLDAQYPRVLLESGILGLLAFLYLVYQLWQQVFLIYKTASDPYEKGLALGFVLGFIGLLVHGIGANTFIIVRIMEPFWLFAGMVMMIPKLGKGEEGGPRSG
jgi:O-antigen ligase